MNLAKLEQKRLKLSRKINSAKKSSLGQFLTPQKTAEFMASLFPDGCGHCRLLDAGAGIGSLSAAFLDRWVDGEFRFHNIEVDAFEVDQDLIEALSETLSNYGLNKNLTSKIYQEDFIHAAADSLSGNLFSTPLEPYTHVIINPPYKKISSRSAHRLALRRVGIETVNLYSAFVALAVALTASEGQIVAIIPRSFCNGPYYRPFRDFILERSAIRHIHLFESRSQAFKDDDVLQENIIIRLERDGQPEPVTISTSTDDNFSDIKIQEHPFDRIIFPDDLERFIHIPTTTEKSLIELSPTVRYSLAELGIQVSTGPVVDFRLKAHLRDNPEPGTVPLIYPGHLINGYVVWPKPELKKPNAIMRNKETEKWLYPNGFYCVVRRFSSKEEKRRVVASVVNPAVFDDESLLGFENHLNLFHENKHGLPETLVHGLSTFLNTTAVDEYFRRFNGHTQVNATDLRQMKYPSRSALIELGQWAMKQPDLTQAKIDAKLDTLTT